MTREESACWSTAKACSENKTQSSTPRVVALDRNSRCYQKLSTLNFKTASQQKVSNWPHGCQRQYITYKAEAEGIGVELEDEAYSSQTCPNCGKRHKSTGRVYYCPACGFVSHRDAVGSANILSRHRQGEVGHVKPPSTIKYRQPFGRAHHQETEWAFASREGKRSRLDTAEMAVAELVARHACQSTEAAPL